jgi:subfamily B ATP-binding cassette protein HlyB/CyaB
MEAERAQQAIDTGLSCLIMLARLHEIAADPDQIAHQFRTDGQPFAKPEILLASKHLGLKVKAVKTSVNRLDKTPLPAMAPCTDQSYIIIAKSEEGKVLIFNPLVGRPEAISPTDLQERWTGELILFTSRASLAGELRKFDFTWFIPAIVKYRKLLTEVLIVSFVLQLFALVTPLFFQVVMDKVLVHRGFTTLDVIAIGLLVVVIFEVTLTGLRSFVFAHTTSRIDVELGARLFRHLLHLPLSYFQARRVGDSVARVRELENIRNFLTSNALTLVLDLLFSVVFIAVMLYYSIWLTLIVLVSLPCYALLSAFCIPILRSILQEKFNRGAENHSFLVEALSGIGTVKAMAVEPQLTRRWDNQLAAYVATSFRATTIGTIAHRGGFIIPAL